MKICGIILAAGSSRRMGASRNKVFIKFEGISALVRSVDTHKQSALFDNLIIVCRKEDMPVIQSKLSRHVQGMRYRLAPGGAERQYSVENALAFVEEDTDIVSVHDAARCFVTPQIIKDCVASAIRLGSGVSAVSAVDTVKRVSGRRVAETLNRDELVLVQTPQVFKKELIMRAYVRAREDGVLGTDDSFLVERLGEDVYIVNGSVNNIKITTPYDLKIGERIAGDAKMISNLRIGSGVDVHALGPGRKLILGGVEVPSDVGLIGHSDADVLVHAMMDALLGAARLGDIGELFPPEDPKYAGISSILLLKMVGELLNNCGYTIINIDATLILQRPKILPYKKDMIRNIASALEIDEQYVSIKATTTEELGFAGRGEGASAHSVCIVQKQW
jgi:2-C-methyl-D-erythritol 4-phosphate cytidylyltransferase/2-C-methyl-D-erythritol 2,4-cyclodiphosphate synthase